MVTFKIFGKELFDLNINETHFLFIILGLLAVDYVWSTILSLRQYILCKRNKTVPLPLVTAISQQTLLRSRQYMLNKFEFSFFEETFVTSFTFVVLYFGILGFIWDFAVKVNDLPGFAGHIAASCFWVFLITSAVAFLGIPFSFYAIFVIERNHGFNQLTIADFIVQCFKLYCYGEVGFMIFTVLIVVLLELGGDFAVIWLWLCIAFLTFMVMVLYPICLLPAVETFEPLPKGLLKEKLEVLADELNFPLQQISLVRGSKRTAHSNAYFVGICKTKRVIIYDTLLSRPDKGGCTTDEIIGIVCHELGHWKYNHTLKFAIFLQVELLLKFTLFSLFIRFPLMYKAVGFRSSQPVIAGLLVFLLFILLPYNNIVLVFVNYVSRRFEYQADKFAVKHGFGEDLKNALVRLYRDNLQYPYCDKWYSVWYNTHPGLLERIEAIEKNMEKMPK